MFAAWLAPILARRGVHYGWIVAGVAFLTVLATAAAMGMAGVLLVPLRQEYGWSNAAISAAFGLRLLLYGFAGPFAAAMLDRYGLRRTVAAALGLIVAGLIGSVAMRSLWQLFLFWGVLLGLGTGMTAMVLAAHVASAWFAARRGLVMGILAAANATGQLLFLPLAAWIAQNAGWRMALVPAGFACTLACALVLLLGADHPSSLGIAAYGESGVRPPPERSGAARAFSVLGQGMRRGDFWLLAGTFFICGFSTSGLVQTHFISFCHDYGVAPVAAASVLALMGAFDFVGTIGSGWLSDRYDSRILLAWYYGLRGLSLLFLPSSGFTVFGLSAFAVFYGLDWIATVPPTVRLAGFAFGRERAALVFGWLFMAHQIGAALASWGGGVSRTVLGSYLPAFYAAGLACLAAALAMLLLQKPARLLAPN